MKDRIRMGRAAAIRGPLLGAPALLAGAVSIAPAQARCDTSGSCTSTTPTTPTTPARTLPQVQTAPAVSGGAAPTVGAQTSPTPAAQQAPPSPVPAQQQSLPSGRLPFTGLPVGELVAAGLVLL